MVGIFLFFSNNVFSQRVISGIDRVCDSTPPPPLEEPPLVDLCSESDVNLATAIEIGQFTNLATSTDLVNAYNQGTFVSFNFHVTSDFYIDNILLFESCKFVIAPNVSIIVTSDGMLRANLSDFYTCQKMWEGIDVRETGRISLKKCKVEDAKIAISLTSTNRRITLEDNIFSRNEVGIYAKNAGNLGGLSTNLSRAFAISSFQGNTFDCLTLLPLKTDKPYKYGMAGMVLDQANLPYLPGSRVNTFRGLIRVGVIAKESWVSMNNCSFDGISYTDKLSSTIGISEVYADTEEAKGQGIYASESSLFVSSSQLLNGNKAEFRNCAKGAIFAKATNLWIDDCSFTANNGINYTALIASINNLKSEIIQINHNKFNIENTTVSGGAVYLERSQNENQISDNNLTVVASSDKTVVMGINVVHSSKSYSYAATLIERNNIWNAANGTFTGISVSGGAGYLVRKNVIPSIGHQLGVGIRVFNVPYGEITENIVSGDDDYTNSKSKGGYCFHIRNTISGMSVGQKGVSVALLICSNTANYGSIGFKFEGNCNTVRFADNNIHTSLYGLVLHTFSGSSSPQIGVQHYNDEYRKNTWIYDSKISNVSNHAVSYAGNPKLSQFGILPSFKTPFNTVVNGKNVPNSYYAFDNIVVPSGYTKDDWFNIPLEPLTVDKGCQPFGGNEPNHWTEGDEYVLKGKYNNNFPATLWEANRQLYEKLMDNPFLLSNYPDRQSFFGKMSNSNISAFNTIEIAMNNMFNTAETENLKLLRATEENIFGHLVTHVQTNTDLYSENTWSDQALQDLRILEIQMTDIKESIHQSSNLLDAERLAIAAQLLEENEAIVPNGAAHETATKKINHYWLKSILQNGSLEAEDIAIIKEVASDCYANVGMNKYYAIDMLPFCEQEPYWDTDCNVISKVIKNNNTTADIFPNPSADKFIFKTNRAVYKVYISDVTGKIMNSSFTNPSDNAYEFTTLHYPDGLYLLNVEYKDGSSQAHKVNIIH
jgi:hypothetical protein